MSDVNVNKTEQRELHRLRKDSFGKYFYNLSQLTFGGVVLGGFLPLMTGTIDAKNIPIELWLGVSLGIISTILFAIIGHYIHRPKY